MKEQHAPPNHHANYPGFKGVPGLVAALSMAFGRKGDVQLAVRLSGMQAGDRVVDVGCGPGVAVRYSARLGATVTGVDPAPVMLRVARLLTRSSANVRYAMGAAEEIPLPDGFCFGGVVDSHCAPLVGHRRRASRGAPGAPLRRPFRRHGAKGRTRCPGTGATDGPTNKSPPLPINVANTALSTFVWSGQHSGADQRSVW